MHWVFPVSREPLLQGFGDFRIYQTDDGCEENDIEHGQAATNKLGTGFINTCCNGRIGGRSIRESIGTHEQYYQDAGTNRRADKQPGVLYCIPEEQSCHGHNGTD